MNEEIRKDILCVLDKSIKALNQKKDSSLSKLSDECITCATIYGDKDFINISVILYALGKLSLRSQIKTIPGWELFRKKVIKELKDAAKLLRSKDVEKYRKTISLLYKDVAKVDNKVQLYIQEVIENAKLKKGCKIYEQGVSIQQSSNAADIDLWELQDYIGKTKIHEHEEFKTNVLNRLKFARSLFTK